MSLSLGSNASAHFTPKNVRVSTKYSPVYKMKLFFTTRFIEIIELKSIGTPSDSHLGPGPQLHKVFGRQPNPIHWYK